jgi:LPS export ABC transporter protein LptC
MTSIINIIKAALLTGCFFIISCENNVQQVNNITRKRVGVEEGKDVKIDYSYGGKAKSEITAPLMLRYADTIPYIEFPNSLHAEFFNALGQIESRLDAKYGRYMESENKVYLRDSVTVLNIAGDTLHCDELYWDRSKIGHEFYTDKPVRIRTKMQMIDGVGLDASQDFKQWHILEPRGPIKIPNSQFPG